MILARLLPAVLLLAGCQMVDLTFLEQDPTAFAKGNRPVGLLRECAAELQLESSGASSGGGGSFQGGPWSQYFSCVYAAAGEAARQALMTEFERALRAEIAAEGWTINGSGHWSLLPGFRLAYLAGDRHGEIHVFSATMKDDAVVVRGILDERSR